MKLLSVAVPCYNSEAYMRHCIATLRTSGEAVGFHIVSGGSFRDDRRIRSPSEHLQRVDRPSHPPG